MFCLYLIPCSFAFECKNPCSHLLALCTLSQHIWHPSTEGTCSRVRESQGDLLPYPLCLLLVPNVRAPPVVPPEFILGCLRISSIDSFFNSDTPLCFRGVLPVATQFPSISEKREISDTTSQNSVPSGTVSDQTILARCLRSCGKGWNKTPSRRSQCLQT